VDLNREIKWSTPRRGVEPHSADNYKSGSRPRRGPLVPEAVEIFKGDAKAHPADRYLLSTDGWQQPIRGISKFYRTQLRDQIIANTGAPLSKHLTSHY